MFLKYDSVYFLSRTSRYPFEHVHDTVMFCDNVVNGLRPWLMKKVECAAMLHW